MSIAIVDYGMANLRSVQKAFAQVGAVAEIISTPEEIDRAEKLVLPGVGAFKDAIATLRQRNLAEAIVGRIQRGKPFLGICLGLQLLVDVGFEDGEHRGLGVIPGKCVRFDVDQTLDLKVPHMGWNQLIERNPSPLTKGLAAGSAVYFVHGFHIVPEDPGVIATETDYGRPFVSSIRKENVMAVQFHPEKSQGVGLQILANFAAWKPQ
ncbi:MAG: imidazole glycerol phosphate synthase subunit HisH [Planctomycetota bacterium]|nr:imidazole glycerol phosphate synthase subunit HisH [Planctomycetota bacterium]